MAHLRMALLCASSRAPQGPPSYSISYLLIFTCLLPNFSATLYTNIVSANPVAPIGSSVGSDSQARSTPVARTTGQSTSGTNNLSHIGSGIAPLIQAAMVVAPKLTPPLLMTSRQPMIVVEGPSQANQQSGSIGESGRLRGQINQEEPIIQLDYSSFSDEILNKQTANFVYFNANFNHCRHCQKFFSVWRELALDIRWWRNVIKLFTINCSDEDNIDVCRRAGVTQFPQLKFYWVMSNSLNQDGQRLRILGKSVHAMRHLIMDKVLDSYLEHNKLLAERDRKRASASAVSNPFGALPGMGPLSTLLPLISQLMGPQGLANTNSSPLGGGGGLLKLVGLLTGKPAPGNGAAGGLSLTNFMNSIGGMHGISQLINALMSMASWRRSLTLQRLPGNWPELEAIETPVAQNLLDMLPIGPGKAAGALLIMETQEFLYTGLEVMLDLNPYTQNQTYYIARVRDERSQLSKKLTKLDDVQAPALIYVDEFHEPKLVMTAPKYTNDEDLRRVFVKAFEKRQVKYPIKRVWSMTGSGAGGSPTIPWRGGNSSEVDEEIIARINDVYMNDLLNTIRLSLTDQVTRHPDLSDDQYNALVKYVYALINYFPFNNDEQLKFFKRLHAWLQNQVSPVDMSEYKKQFHDVDEYLGKRRAWVACKSLSNVNSIPNKKSNSLFENPSQFGKVVSNITRLFRANQQKVGQLKNLVGMFASSLNSPVVLSNQQQVTQQQRPMGAPATGTSVTQAPASEVAPAQASSPPPTNSNSNWENKDKKEESSLERLIKSVTSGSLGSDSSILRLISTVLGGGGTDPKPGKSKFAREYSCGAWKLAHAMVVNEYIRDSPRKDVKHIVLHSLYQYMLHFYACATCGNRVSDVSSEFRLNLNDHLNDQGDSIMLLWKIHNRINKRLEGELRPGSPAKQQFPSESLCPKCRASKKQTDLGVSTPNWYEKQVLNFLVHHYRPENIITNVNSSDSSSSSSPSIQPPHFAASPLGLLNLTNWLTILACCFTIIWCRQPTVVLRSKT